MKRSDGTRELSYTQAESAGGNVIPFISRRKKEELEKLRWERSITSTREAALIYGASPSTQPIYHPPFYEPPSGSEYFVWTGMVQTRMRDFIICSLSGAPHEGFAIDSIKTAFDEISLYTRVEVVGRFTDLLTVYFEDDTTKEIPILEDCYVARIIKP